MSAPFLVCAAMTLLSALISLGFSMASANNETGQARTLASYACARSVAFAILSACPIVNHSAPWLEAAASGMIIVQALDAAIGVGLKDRMKTFGPAATAIVNLAALVWFMARA